MSVIKFAMAITYLRLMVVPISITTCLLILWSKNELGQALAVIGAWIKQLQNS